MVDEDRVRTRRGVLTSGGVALATVLAGCGGDGGDGESSSSPTAGGAPTGTPTTSPDTGTEASTDQATVGAAGPTEAWRHGHDTDLSFPLVTDDALFYIASGEESRYVARELDTGEQRWERPTGDTYWADLAIAGGTLYTVDDERLLALNPTDGSIRWETASIPTSRLGSFYTANADRVFVCAPETVVGIDSQSSEQLWEREFPGDGSMIAAITLGPGGVVHVTSTDGTLATFDQETGDTLWTYSFEPWCCGPIITTSVVDGTLYLGHDDPNGGNHLLAFDPESGDQYWANDGTYARGKPHLYDDRLFVPLRDTSSTIVALDPSTGEEDSGWRTDAGVSTQLHLNFADGAFYHLVGSEHDSIAAIDTADGSIRWQYPTDSAHDLTCSGQYLLYETGQDLVALTRP